MKRTDPIPKPGEVDCPVREILDRVGDKWSTLVITNLVEGTLRFSELKRRISGISQRMLTETVRSLERDGVLRRTIYPSIPPKVEYSLTPLGKSLVPLVLSLVNWAVEHRSQIRRSRAAYDVERTRPLAPVQVPPRGKI